MSFSNMLYTLFIGPLEILFEVIFVAAYKLVNNPGLSIMALSLVMNLILLPLYKRTDAIQEEAIETEKRMKPFVTHIKKTFKGNEQFMMLQTCYRQNNYKPTDAIKGLTPLILEIPFFMAAYNYLSGLTLLYGVSLGPIANLGAPDRLLTIGTFSINVLPIIMTIINVVSSMIYTKDAPLKTKIQLYGMAALFLVLLYDSPSALAFYWTLNNLFSLVKNALMKTKKPMAIISGLSTFASVVGTVLIFTMFEFSGKKLAFSLLLMVLLNIPLVMLLMKKYRKSNTSKPVTITSKDTAAFFVGCLVMVLLIGVLIPASLIHASPEEFIIVNLDMNPNIAYVLHTALLAAGAFLVWLGLFYALANPVWKKRMELGIWILCGIAITDHMFFGKNYGNLSSSLIFDDPIENSTHAILINILVLTVVTLVISIIVRKKKGLLVVFGSAAIVAMIGMSAMNISQSQRFIDDRMAQLKLSDESKDEVFTLSKNGKNVVILMMDRAINSFVPYIFNEMPELQEQFSGFTYYPNTLSFGGHTSFGLPAVFGGYEYTPLEMNKRDTLPLEEKHNEALTVLPALFDQNGFKVSVCDPTYAGYKEIPDLSIYDDYPNIETHITMTQDSSSSAETASETQRKVFFYSAMKVSPLLFQKTIYDNGDYLKIGTHSTQILRNNLIAVGRDPDFEISSNVLNSLPQRTRILDNDENTFQMMCNDTSHSPTLLQLPNYEFTDHVDNTPFDQDPATRTDADGNTIELSTIRQIRHYHCNAATYIEIGKWLDYLKENDVYDNTRIIIVSDHGMFLDMGEDWKFDYEDPTYEDHSDIMFFNPVLLVKDFNSKELKVDNTFMTNADTPSIALSGLIDHPVNPFTGHEINSDMKNSDSLYITLSYQHSPYKNCGNTFNPDPWAKLTGNMFDPNNWHVVQPEDLP